MELKLEAELVSKNDEQASENRSLFAEKGVFVLNIVGSPGAGKTTLVEAMIDKLSSRLHIGVIEGDLATANDAERIRRHNVPVIQINTNGGCHLDAGMIKKVLPVFDLQKLDLLIIENVGNLVCPCDFDLGESLRLLVLSTPEGEDKPQKYPNAVLTSNVVVINKADLLPYLNINIEAMHASLRNIKNDTIVFDTAADKGTGVAALCEYFEDVLKCR